MHSSLFSLLMTAIAFVGGCSGSSASKASDSEALFERAEGGAVDDSVASYIALRQSGTDHLLRWGGVDARTGRAILRDLEWLAAAQQPDGSWSFQDFAGDRALSRSHDAAGSDTLVLQTAIVLEAFLANGFTPEQGTHGDTVRNGVGWLCARQRDSGAFPSRSDAARGASLQAIATLVLVESCADRRFPRVVERANRALAALRDMQSAGGLWWERDFDGRTAWRRPTLWAAFALWQARNLRLVDGVGANGRAYTAARERSDVDASGVGAAKDAVTAALLWTFTEGGGEEQQRLDDRLEVASRVLGREAPLDGEWACLAGFLAMQWGGWLTQEWWKTSVRPALSASSGDERRVDVELGRMGEVDVGQGVARALAVIAMSALHREWGVIR